MSNTNEDNFERQWQEAFEDAEANPSPLVWSELEKKLDANHHYFFRNRHLIGALLLLLFFTVSGIYLWTNSLEVHPKEKASVEKEKITDSEDKRPNLSLESKQDADKQVDTTPEAKDTFSNQSKNTLQASTNPQTTELPTLTPTHSASNESLKPGQNRDTKAEVSPFFTAQKNPSPSLKDTKDTSVTSDLSHKTLHSSSTRLWLPELKPIESQDTHIEDVAAIVLDNLVFAEATLSMEPQVRQSSFWLSFSLAPSSFDPLIQAKYNNYLDNYLHTHNKNDVTTDNFFDALQEVSNPAPSLAFTGQFGWQMSPKLSLRTGLQYGLYRRQRITNGFFEDQSSNNDEDFLNNIQGGDLTDRGFVDALERHQASNPDSGNEVHLEQFNRGESIRLTETYTFLSIPLQVGYRFNPQSRFKVSLYGGIHTDILLSIRSRNRSGGSDQRFTQANTSIYKQLNLSAAISLQIERQISARWSAFLEPSYRKSLGSWTREESYLRVLPSSYGLGFGLKYQF